MQQYQIEIWSPKFKGSAVAWAWVCESSNGRIKPPNFLMSREQLSDARACGYLNVTIHNTQRTAHTTILGARGPLKELVRRVDAWRASEYAQLWGV